MVGAAHLLQGRPFFVVRQSATDIRVAGICRVRQPSHPTVVPLLAVFQPVELHLDRSYVTRGGKGASAQPTPMCALNV